MYYNIISHLLNHTLKNNEPYFYNIRSWIWILLILEVEVYCGVRIKNREQFDVYRQNICFYLNNSIFHRNLNYCIEFGIVYFLYYLSCYYEDHNRYEIIALFWIFFSKITTEKLYSRFHLMHKLFHTRYSSKFMTAFNRSPVN